MVGTRGLSLYRVTTPQELGAQPESDPTVNDLVPVVANSAPYGLCGLSTTLSGVMQPPQSTVIANSFTVAPRPYSDSRRIVHLSLAASPDPHQPPARAFCSPRAFTHLYSIDDSSDLFDTAVSLPRPRTVRIRQSEGPGFDDGLRSVNILCMGLGR